MAINWTTLFGDVGKLVATINGYDALGDTTLPADLADLISQLNGRWLPAEGLASYYNGLRDQVTSWRQGLAGYCDRRLTDPDTVLTQLGLDPYAGITAAVPALLRQMVTDGQTVKACTCAAGAVTPAAGNSGDGTAWPTLVLDGYNPPLLGAQANVLYNGRQSELCVPSETMTLECVADSVIDGLPEGAETWRWTGGPAYSDLDVRAEGSGRGPGLTCASAGSTLLVNGDMELWSSGVPTGWTLASGTAGTHLAQDTSTCYRGASSAKLIGSAALTTVRLTQAVSSGLVQGKRRYFVGCALKASAAASGAAFRLYFQGTGYSPGEQIDVDGGSFPTGWAQQGAYVTMPAGVPSDWKLALEVTGLPAGASVWVDSVCMAPAVYHGGLGCAVTAGAARWQRGDRLTFAVTNDGAGLFQSFFRRRYKAQLPSVKVGSQGYFLGLLFTLMTAAQAETVTDAWAA